METSQKVRDSAKKEFEAMRDHEVPGSSFPVRADFLLRLLNDANLAAAYEKELQRLRDGIRALADSAHEMADMNTRESNNPNLDFIGQQRLQAIAEAQFFYETEMRALLGED